MQMLRNQGAAVLITLAIVAFSVLFGSNFSLNRLREQAENVYSFGEDGSGQGIESDISDIAQSGENQITVAQRYLDENDALIAAVRSGVDGYSDAYGPDAQFDAEQAMLQAIRALDTRLRAETAVSADDKVHLDRIIADVEAAHTMIGRSTYNEYARQFNEELSSFPANVLGAVAGTKPLEYFE